MKEHVSTDEGRKMFCINNFTCVAPRRFLCIWLNICRIEIVRLLRIFRPWLDPLAPLVCALSEVEKVHDFQNWSQLQETGVWVCLNAPASCSSGKPATKRFLSITRAKNFDEDKQALSRLRFFSFIFGWKTFGKPFLRDFQLASLI